VKGIEESKSPVNIMGSPASIVSSLASQPPPMKALPEPMAVAPKPDEPSLPSTAVWGGRRIWTSPRGQEVLNQWLDDVQLLSRSKLAIKTHSTYSEMQRAEKAKQKGLMHKHWGKKRVQKSRARAAADALAEQLAMQMAGDADAPGIPTRPPEATSDSAPVCRDGKMRGERRKNGVIVAKLRRSQRRAARDRKCFAFDDAENLPVAPAPHTLRAKKKPVPFKKSYAYMLLCSEPLGPVLSDLFSGGLMLSMPATLDLEEMLGHKRKARARAVDAPPDQTAAKEASPARASVKKAATKMLAKRGKDRSKPSSYLRMPKAVNGSAGKRCC